MKLFFHYCPFGFSNCYILGTDYPEGEPSPEEAAPPKAGPRKTAHREAIIVDPGSMDDQILGFIENNEYRLRAVLITHDHLNHVHGLRTLKRIYNAEIYAVNHAIMDHKTNLAKDGDTITIGPFQVGVISIPGHSADSAVFLVDNLLFTGDALTAGLVGRTASAYGAAVQMRALRSRILSLPGDYIVLPGHGPPSTLEAERKFNYGIAAYDQNRNQRPVFRMDI
ncbi:MAG: MBL fold metallo-hydrolase [Treponema sp.]|jgi:glyoxylase-like metal-dependent hydrolase (beta-lactamase superfamily II)|nr:MBL fold metallo-hydrolase [Treponema sp.]